MGEIFFHRSSAVFRRRTSDLVHLTICFPRIRSPQRIIARVEWELAICRKNRNRTRTNISEISIQSAMEAVLGLMNCHLGATLMYLYWEPTDKDFSVLFQKHRDEIGAFADRVANGNPSFEAMTYGQLWDAWDGSGNRELSTHVRNLRSRYQVARG